MKQIKKMSLSNVISKLSRKEMRSVMAGSGCGNKIVEGHLWVCTDGKWEDMGPYNPGF